MIEKFIRDYFSFTRRERIAVLALSSMLVIIFSLSHFIPAKEAKISLKDLELPGGDSSPVTTIAGDSSVFEEKIKPVKRFRFDPNSLDVAGWQSLGVRDKTITTIQHYLAKGGQFRSPEDLLKVYGLNAELARELMPYVNVKAGNISGLHSYQKSNYKNFGRDNPESDRPRYHQGQSQYEDFKLSPSGSGRGRFETSRKIPVSTDIAIADSQALVNLPGIGPRLASRIMNFREKLGGFYSVDQLAETFGLPDSTFRNLKPYLTVSFGKIQKIPLNGSSIEMLRSHPYIRWNLAHAIIAYRTEHGPFLDIVDLNRIALVTPEIFAKLSPYLQL